MKQNARGDETRPDARRGFEVTMKPLSSALDAIGRTPLVHLNRLHPGPGTLLAKAEFLQPGGSVKDRAAKRIVLDALHDGRLLPGQAVVEMTSGNMGAGLAVVCAVTGNPFTAVMSAGNSPERARMVRAFGAEVLLVPQVDGAPGQVTGADIARAEHVARNLAQERGAFYVDQFNNACSVRAHEEGTGPEIWEAVGDRLAAFVAAVGSGGTFVGTSRYLKRRSRGVLCVAVEPQGAAVLARKPLTKPRHLLQGTGYGQVPPHWDPTLADKYIEVSDEAARAEMMRLASREGLFVGFSAAANVHAARTLLQSGSLAEDATVVTVLCDTGLKYTVD
jgi:cysteine synthase A